MSRIAGLFVVVALVAACGAAGAPPTPTPTIAPTASPAGANVSVGQTSLGPVLVAPDGHTLYGFIPDQAAGKPTCNGTCAANWPPLTVTGTITVGAGLTMSNFKTVARDDGSMQVETGGFPLYEFVNDKAAGDTTGQGVNHFFAMGSNGQLIGAPAAVATPAASAAPAAGTAAPTDYVKPTPAGTY